MQGPSPTSYFARSLDESLSSMCDSNFFIGALTRPSFTHG